MLPDFIKFLGRTRSEFKDIPQRKIRTTDPTTKGFQDIVRRALEAKRSRAHQRAVQRQETDSLPPDPINQTWQDKYPNNDQPANQGQSQAANAQRPQRACQATKAPRATAADEDHPAIIQSSRAALAEESLVPDTPTRVQDFTETESSASEEEDAEPDEEEVQIGEP